MTSESIRAIHRALELGVTFFDTANVYGAGHSERVLAQALAGRRDQVVIATKFSSLFDEATRQVTGSSAEPESIRQQCDESLRRLNTDYIDLYQFHWNDYPADQAGVVRDTLEGLVTAGQNPRLRLEHRLPRPGAGLRAGRTLHRHSGRNERA